MRIGIVGNYGNDNNGDEAILLSIIRQLTDLYSLPPSALTVFSNNPEQTANRYGVESHPLYRRGGSAPRTFWQTRAENAPLVAQLDLLVIGGGGILMDLYRREAPLFGLYAMMAKAGGVPYVVYGCGAGPLSTGLGKWFIRYMCKHADSVSVRDPKSRELLQAIGVQRPVELVGDPAFSLKIDAPSGSEAPKRLAVTAVPYFNEAYWPSGDAQKYDDYISGMARNLDRLLDSHPCEITFFATKYPQDADVTKDIQRKMTNADQTSIIDDNLLPVDILDVTDRHDIVIGTRLHSLILATATETPIIAVSYHHKVRDFMNMAELDPFLFEMGDIERDSGCFLRAYNALNEDWSASLQQAKELSEHLRDQAMKGTRQFTDALPVGT